MSSYQRVSPSAIHALKEALTSVFWYKKDLRGFLNTALSDRGIVATQANWDDTKVQIVSDIVGFLCDRQELHLGDLQRLFAEVARFKDFSHLERLEDGKSKAARARKAVLVLADLVKIHDSKVKEVETVADRRNRESVRLGQKEAHRGELEKLRARFIEVVSTAAPQERGYLLERLVFDLFVLFDLDPKASFKTHGEQIDGAFCLDGSDWLFEAKWQSKPVEAADLDVFAAKVQRKLDNTLGLFLSINGFVPNALSLYSQSRPVFILMTGADLMAILEGRVEPRFLIMRKRQHASRTGQVLLEFTSLAD